MHHRDRSAYEQFAAYVVRHDALNYPAIVKHVMNASGGGVDPNMIVEWIDQWLMLRMAEYVVHERALPKDERT